MHLKFFLVLLFFIPFSKDKFETPSKLKVIIFSVLSVEIFSKLRPSSLLLIKKKCIKKFKIKTMIIKTLKVPKIFIN